MFAMSFVWPTTVWLLGMQRSVPFIALVLCTALVSCMSSVVFLPYMARFKPVYIAAYYIGQGLCGLVPGLVGLAQVCFNPLLPVKFDLVFFDPLHYSKFGE